MQDYLRMAKENLSKEYKRKADEMVQRHIKQTTWWRRLTLRRPLTEKQAHENLRYDSITYSEYIYPQFTKLFELADKLEVAMKYSASIQITYEELMVLDEWLDRGGNDDEK
jgi:hypothetical protein